MATPSTRTAVLLLALIGAASLMAITLGMRSDNRDSRPRLFTTPAGIIITDDSAKARWARDQLDAAAENFQRTFGRSPPKGMIVESPFIHVAQSIPKSRRGWTLAWMTPLFGAGGSTAGVGNGHHLDNESGMRHELTHLFFTARILPNTRGLQYGGDAPDWLDEAAAISAETRPVRAARMAALRSQVCAGRLVPLNRFLTRQHPLFDSASMRKMLAEQREGNSGGPVMMTVRPDQIDVPERDIADFYAEAAGLLAYLVERSGDAHVLNRVAADVRGRRDQTAWQDDPALLDKMRLRSGEMSGDFERWALKQAHCGESQPGASSEKTASGRTTTAA